MSSLPGAQIPAVRVLLIEDMESDAALVMAHLALPGVQDYALHHEMTLRGACQAAADGGFEVAVLDIHLPDGAGVTTVERLHEAAPQLPIVCLTGADDEELALACVEAGAHAYLEKSRITNAGLRRTLSHTLARVRRERLQALQAAQRYEAELVRLNEQLAQSNRDLESFGRVAAHDLSGPLASALQVVGWVRADLPRGDSSDAAANLDLLERRLSRMRELIRDALAWAAAGRGGASQEPVALGPFITQLFADCAPPEGFELERVPEVTARLTKGPLTQVLRNLFANSIVHHGGETGRIAVQIHWADTDPSLGPHLVFEVSDDGAGIAESLRARVFEMGVSSGARREGHGVGAGMGLAIVSRIVQRAGGTIELLSPDVGAAFRLTWPASPVE